MENILLIVAMVSFALSASIFIMAVLQNGLKGFRNTKSSKIASVLFFIYIITFASFLIIFN